MCGCQKTNVQKFEWTSDDGTETATYSSEIVAKAKVKRAGGSYEPLNQASGVVARRIYP